MGGLYYILNLKNVPTFRMPSIRQVWLLIQQGDYPFTFVVKDASLHVPIAKHYH